MVQRRRTSRISEILTVVNHEIEFVRSCKYRAAAISNTNDETEEIRAIILVANRARSSLHICLDV